MKPPRLHRRIGCRLNPVQLEPLEPRCLLSADLAISQMDVSGAPAAAVVGQAVTYDVRLLVTNPGDERIASRQRIDVELLAVPEAGDPVAVGLFQGISVSSLKPGAVKTIKLVGELPGTLPKGAYQLVAVLDAADAVAEADETNNESQPAGRIRVDDPFVDLAALVATNRLPSAVISGDGKKITLNAAVRNDGNVPLVTEAALVADILAMPTSGAAGVVVGSFPLTRINGLSPGKTAKQRFSVELPPGLASDLYRLVVSVDPGNAIGEPYDVEGRPLTRENNTAATDPATPIDVTEGFYDVAVEVDTYDLPPEAVTGQRLHGAVGLRLINRGNIPLPDTQLGVSLLARSAGEDQSAGSMLLELPPQKVFRLKPGAAKRIMARVNDLVSLLPGDYRVSALADNRDALAESNESNEAPPQPLAMVEPYVDLSARVDGSQLPTQVTAGAPMDVAVIVRNNGNVTIPDGQLVGIDVFSNRIERGILTFEYRGPFKQLLGSFPQVDIGGLAPGKERSIPLQVEFGEQRKGFPYSISAEVDTADVIAEADEQNNGANAGRLHAGVDDLAFATTNQSMWGLDTAILDTGLKFLGTTWNTSGPLFDVDAGVANAEVYASSRGRVGVDFQATLDTGSVDASYSDTVSLEVNEVARYTYSIKGKLDGTPTGSLVTRSPSIDISSNLIFDVEATVGVRGYAPFAGNFDESLKVIDTNGATLNLLTLNNRQFSVLGDDLAMAEPEQDLSFSADLTFNPVLRAFEADLKDENSKPKKEKPHSKNPLEDAIEFSAGDVTVYVPNIGLEQDEYAGTYLPTIRAAGQADLMRLDLDVDFLAVTGALFASGVPTPGALGATFGVDGLFDVELDIVDFDAGPVVSIKQDFRFEALPAVTYVFNHPVGIIDPNHPENPPTQFVTSHTTSVGQPFDFYYKGDDLQIATSYEVNGTLHNITDLIAAAQYELDVLRVGGSVLGIDLGSAQVLERDGRGQAARLATLFNQEFELGGFQPATGQTVALNLSGGSSIVNLV